MKSKFAKNTFPDLRHGTLPEEVVEVEQSSGDRVLVVVPPHRLDDLRSGFVDRHDAQQTREPAVKVCNLFPLFC